MTELTVAEVAELMAVPPEKEEAAASSFVQVTGSTGMAFVQQSTTRKAGLSWI